MPHRALRSSLTAAVLFALSPCAQAGTLYVANNGVDAPGCGPKTLPCRSISRAIATAVAGDKIVVGPGRYGDLNRDGDLFDPGEETGVAFCGCLVGVDKPVTLTSSDGAAATIIDARNIPAVRNVLIVTDGATFGSPGKGFTLTNTALLADGDGVLILGSDNTFRGNQVVAPPGTGNVDAIGIETADTAPGPNLIEGNQAIGWDAGISARGAGTTVRKNKVSQSYDFGIFVTGTGGTVIGNVATANGYGIAMAADTRAIGNAMYGNLYGFTVGGMFGGVFEKNNVFGNSNCGADHAGGDLLATNNYWGAATGPGDDPADKVCELGGSTTTVVPFATKPFKVKAPIKP